MSDQYISEIRIVSFNFPPRGWALCNGQLMSIARNQALFSLLGTTYGGDGQTTFALPNLQGRLPMHAGNKHVLGESLGTATVTLTAQQLPNHTHPVQASTSAGETPVPTNTALSATPALIYGQPSGNITTLNPINVGTAGGSAPHDNMMPSLTLNFIIATTGIFPSKN